MAEQILRHYREGGKLTHSGVEILPNGKDIDYIVIKEVKWSENEEVNGTVKPSFIAVFEKNPYTERPMVLNAKNKKTLLTLTKKGEYELETIKNLPVHLTKESTKMGLGLRISLITAKKPGSAVAEKARLELDSPNFETIKAWLIETPEHSIETTTKKYDVSPEALAALKKAKDESIKQ